MPALQRRARTKRSMGIGVKRGTTTRLVLRQPSSRLALAAVVAVALVLRLWNAETAFIHDDETHYAGDAAWAYADISWADAVKFLRNHPRDHDRIDPATGRFDRWGEDGRYPRLGHPAFYALVLGGLTTAAPPDSPETAVRYGRVLNAAADTITVLLLPALLSSLGFSTSVGLVAALVYAVYPPAVTYGSLAYLDAFLAPLFLAALIPILRASSEPRSWIFSGIATGLLVSTKQTGLVALVVLPLIGVAHVPRPHRGLVLWAVATLAVLLVVTNPVAYVDCILHPLDSYAKIRPNPLQTLASNLSFLSRPYDYYWLSYSKHGRPLAAAIAPLHHLLTPPILWLFALSVPWVLTLRRWPVTLAIHLPVLGALLLLPPSDGAWRVHVVAPLVAAGAAITLTQGRLAARVAALALAVLVGSYHLLPATAGHVSLADLLRADPALAESQPHGFYDPFKKPLALYVGPNLEVRRTLWLPPGGYEIGVAATVWTTVVLDGEVLLSGLAGTTTFDVTDRIHRMELRFMEPGTLETLWIKTR